MGNTQPLIEADRSISVAANMSDLNELKRIVKLTSDVPGVLSYTLGRGIGLSNLEDGVGIVEEYGRGAKAVYEHHKASTEDSDTAQEFIESMQRVNAKGVVVFYGDDLQSHRHWLEALRNSSVKPVVGPEISRHRQFSPEMVRMVLRQAVQLGVKDIWVRGDDHGRVGKYHEMMRSDPSAGNYTLWVPRWVDRQGNIQPRRRLEPRFVTVIGSAICKADDPRKAALQYSEQLVGS